MIDPALRDDPIERARIGPSDPEPIVIRRRSGIWSLGWRRADTVVLTPVGLGWDDAIDRKRHDVEWARLGGLQALSPGKGGVGVTLVHGLDGSRLGTIGGWFERVGPPAMLPHVVALYRPDLFVEVEPRFGYPAGCVRREVAGTEP